MTVLWTASDAATATGGCNQSDWAASGVSIDTRTIQAGDLFVALKDVRDGHDFVKLALEKGAAAALVTHRPDGVPDDAPLLIVEDVLQALENLGRFARQRTTAKVVGVTGSVGKTSTKEMLRTVLQKQGKTHVAEASYNNHWGVPLTLARMPQDADFAVIEIGMNHPGEIAPLAKLAQLDIAMITTVAAAHLEAFGSVDDIAVEKSAIIEGLLPSGKAVLNADIETAAILLGAAASHDVIEFGTTTSDWRVCNVRLNDHVTIITAMAHGQEYLFKLCVPGRHFAMNAVGVLAVVDALGADVTRAALDLFEWCPPNGRGTHETINLDEANEGNALTLIDDAFNANPTSMTAALEILAASTPRDGVGRIEKGRRIAILGDMLELGPQEISLHQAIVNDAAIDAFDVVHCVGPLMRHLWQLLPAEKQGECTNAADALRGQVAKLVDAGDVVLVKGSKGSKVSTIVDAIRNLGHRRG